MASLLTDGNRDEFKTNSDIFVLLSGWGNPMQQSVMVEAITKYVNQVAATDTKPDDWPELIGWGTWKDAAQNIKDTFDDFYGTTTAKEVSK